MGWKMRGDEIYYYRSQRDARGRSRQVYVGKGTRAAQEATELATRRAAKARDRLAAQQDDERHAAAIAPLLRVIGLSTTLVAGQMAELGFHRHDRGPWRKRRMFQRHLPTAPVEYPPEVIAASERAMNGDHTALPEVRKAFIEHPTLLAEFGDLTRIAEKSLVEVLAKDNLIQSEAASRHAEDRRVALFAECESEVEKLLVERIVLCEMEVQVAVTQSAKVAWNEASKVSAGAEKRVDQAHARLLAATRALADVRRALRPTRTPLDLVRGGTNEGPVERNRLADRGRPVAHAEPVDN
jgi:hypothetical protein